MATPCIYRSIALAAGESFVLPPGAELIGATDSTQLSSENDCANLDNVETPECYCFQIVCTEEGGGTTPVFKEDNVSITGLYVASTNTSYPFTIANPTTIQSIYYTGEAALQSTQTIGGLITNTCKAYDSDSSGDRGQVVTLCFKTLPSIGDYLFLKAQTGALLTPDFTAYYDIPAQKYADTIGTKCECTDSLS